jgi:hypothetical protein
MRTALAVLIIFFASVFGQSAFAQSRCGVKNQTDKEVLASLVKTDSGTCVFLVPAPEKGLRQYSKTVREDLTFDDCATRGEDATAFKWYPLSAMSIEQIRQKVALKCGGACSGFPAICPGVCYCVGADHCE